MPPITDNSFLNDFSSIAGQRLADSIDNPVAQAVSIFLSCGLFAEARNMAFTAERLEDKALDFKVGFAVQNGMNPGPTPDEIAGMTTQELVQSLRIEQGVNAGTPAQNIQPILSRDEAGALVLDELRSRVESDPSTIPLISSELQSKNEVDQGDPVVERSIQSASGPVLDALSNLVNNGLSVIGLGSSAAARVSNRTLDGRRVSREYSEYQYCRTSQQIQETLAFMLKWDAGNLGPLLGPIAEGAGLGYGLDLNSTPINAGTITIDSVSYGQFVDMHCLRAMIARIRSIRRKVFAANVKCILDLIPNGDLDQGGLFNQLLSQLDWSDVRDEWNRTFNNRVQYGTNRQLYLNKENVGDDDFNDGELNDSGEPTGS